MNYTKIIQGAVLVGAALLLTACGGGGGDSQANTQSVSYPSGDADARRFLTQATFGPTDAAVAEVKAQGYEPWIDAQLQATGTQGHRAYWDARQAALKAAGSGAGQQEISHGFWAHAMTAPDQLRQRVAFALSEIFVISMVNDCVNGNPQAVAAYMDTLADNAFGTFRQLLTKVSKHPMMGCYLSHLRNQRENAATGRVPDENYAREVMQLFTIGLYQLHADGTQVLGADGKPLETYTADDVAGLAKVFTGFSFDCPDFPDNNCFFAGVANNNSYADRNYRDMVGYGQYHSQSEKRFLGRVLAASQPANPEADFSAAMDLLAVSHPNVGPFIGKQLIQRLVTSNPSPAYVGRVTAAFERSGRNLGAMVKAILTDPEARDMGAALTSDSFGKVREPLLRLSAFLRATDARTDSGFWQIEPTDDANSLAQSVFRSPSVFNFFRPGYMYPGGYATQRGLVAPELQIASEGTAGSYVNVMMEVARGGAGRTQNNNPGKVYRRDVQPAYNLDTTNAWYLMASTKARTDELIEQVNQKLMYGSLSEALRSEMKATLDALPLTEKTDKTAPTDAQIRTRLQAAWLMALVSPEFLVQK